MFEEDPIQTLNISESMYGFVIFLKYLSSEFHELPWCTQIQVFFAVTFKKAPLVQILTEMEI